MSRIIVITVLLATTVIIAGAGAAASPIEYEPIYYDDQVYQAINPGGQSNNRNQLTYGCFDLGPDLNGKAASATIPVYAVLWSGANQHVCPDGSLAHDHVVVAVPGEAGWSPHWKVVFIIPIDENVLELPFTSNEQVEAAIAAGQVAVVETGLIINAPVVKRAGS